MNRTIPGTTQDFDRRYGNDYHVRNPMVYPHCEMFDRAGSSSSGGSLAALSSLPPNNEGFPVNIQGEDQIIYGSSHGYNSSADPRAILYLPSFERNIPSYILDAYLQFASHVKKSNELKGLKLISIILPIKNGCQRQYRWHHHNQRPVNGLHEPNQKNFSYSILKLDKSKKTREPLKTDQDRWISHLLHASEWGIC
jgi:hypothetical protein